MISISHSPTFTTQRTSNVQPIKHFMKTTSHKTETQPLIENNAMPAEQVGDNIQETLTIQERHELQANQLLLGWLESTFHSILEEEGIINDPEAIQDKINSVTDDQSRQTLNEYYETCFDDRKGKIGDISKFEEMAEWMGCTSENLCSVRDKGINKIRRNPELRKLLTDDIDNQKFVYSRADYQ